MSEKFGLTPEAEKKIRDTLVNDVKRISELKREIKRLREVAGNECREHTEREKHLERENAVQADELDKARRLIDIKLATAEAERNRLERENAELRANVNVYLADTKTASNAALESMKIQGEQYGTIERLERELQEARETEQTLQKEWWAEREKRERAEALLRRLLEKDEWNIPKWNAEPLIEDYFANRDKEQGCSRCNAIGGSKHSPECEAGCI